MLLRKETGGNGNRFEMFFSRCTYCKKDLCENCIGHEDCTPGDYRDVFCKKCWEIGNEYRPVIGELNARVDALYKEWQDKCKDTNA